MNSWHSPQSVYQLGHKAVTEILNGPVLTEEKIDGSFFAFGVYNGELRCRSKGATLNLLAPEQMFRAAIETAKELAPLLTPGWQYRGEYLSKPHHNALTYSRVPNKHVIIFDILTGEEEYLPYGAKTREAERLGLEVVPLLHTGRIDNIEMFRSLLETESILGGQKIEGVVVKRYDLFGLDKKALFAKYVSEAFKEVHAKEWKQANPQQGDIVQLLIEKYRTPARWQKARMHLREAGVLEGSMRDTPHILKEVPEDIKKEHEEDIREELFCWAWPKLRRGVVAGLPEWLKKELLQEQFREKNDDNS